VFARSHGNPKGLVEEEAKGGKHHQKSRKEQRRRHERKNGTLHRGIRGHNMKKRRNWRDFLEENRKLSPREF
jgi:hypothetical protein